MRRLLRRWLTHQRHAAILERIHDVAVTGLVIR